MVQLIRSSDNIAPRSPNKRLIFFSFSFSSLSSVQAVAASPALPPPQSPAQGAISYCAAATLRSLLFLLLISAVQIQAQSPPPSPDPQYQYGDFISSTAYLVVVLVAAMFFIGFLSVYIRYCSRSVNNSNLPLTDACARRTTARGIDPVIFFFVALLARRSLVRERDREREVTGSKNIGFGFKTPREAIEGTYIDKKCPFTGNVSMRGRILAGTCHSAKMVRTIIVRRNYLHFIKKYQRYEKRHSNIAAHVSPCFRVKEITLSDFLEQCCQSSLSTGPSTQISFATKL